MLGPVFGWALTLALLAGCGGQGGPEAPGTGGVTDAGALGGLDSGGLGGLDSGAVVGADSGALGGRDSGAASCPGGSSGGGAGTAGGGAGAIPPTFATVKLVFGGGGGIMPCAAAPCHGVNGAAPPDHPLELPPTNDAQLHSNLLSYVSKACNNTKLVEPCSPAKSALVTILKGACGQTPRMPYGCSPQAGDCIPDEYIAAVTQWIANGAPR